VLVALQGWLSGVVADEGEQIAALVDALREIALPLERCGNRAILLRLRLELLLIFRAPEEEQLSLFRLNSFGIKAGPPMVYPASLKRNLLRCRPSRLFFQLLAFSPSLRWKMYPLP